MPPEQVPGKFQQIQDLFTQPAYSSAFTLAIFLVVGGLMAMYIRLLYRWSSPGTTGDSIAKVFPLLTLVTIAVIAIVKSSLALSLGLVGALSIVRFRAAIKDPEELVYLFLCIGVGLALGAEQFWLAVALVVVATGFVLVFDRLTPRGRSGDAYVTVIGSATQYFNETETSALHVIQELCTRVTVQRCDVDGDEGQLRVCLHRVDNNAAPQIVAGLRKRLPECQISYVDAGTLL